jgi:4-amino-4-deoxy-L-arabinose transferase-like glycosyltransferase
MLQHWRISLVVAAIAATVFLAGLGSSRLWDEDEPKNSVCGQEMLARGDWIVPTFNDQLRTDKPILLYWCMIAVYHVLGASEFADRLPSALAGIGTALLTFHLGRLMFNARTGLLASCALAAALMFAVLARGATPDALLIFCITASITSFAAGVASRREGQFNGITGAATGEPRPIYDHGLPAIACLGMYVAMGFAVLAKGPIGVVMPLGVIGSYLLFFDGRVDAPAGSGWLRRMTRYFAPRRILRVARTMQVVWGLPLALAVALPWYILVAIQTDGEWIKGFLGTHNIGRFMHPMEHHRGLPIYYVVAIMVGFFPASAFLPVALWKMVGAVRQKGKERPAVGLLLCWIGCYVGFFTLAATKLPNYVVPCYPALAVAVGAWLDAAICRSTARDWRLRAGYWSVVVVGVGATITLAIMTHTLLNIDPLPALPGVVAIIGGIVCLLVLRAGRVRGSVVAFLVSGLAFTSSAMIYTGYRASQLEEGPLLADHVQELVATSQEVPSVATYRYFTPSFVYYLGHSVRRLTSSDELAAFFVEGGDAVVMPRDFYDQERARLPSDVTILADEQRFLRKRDRIVLVGRMTEIARGDTRAQSR